MFNPGPGHPVEPAVNVPLTNTFSRPVQIRYNGPGQMDIVSVEASHEAIGLELTKDPAGKLHRLAVTIAAGFEPPPTETAKITVNTGADRPPLIIPITLTVGHRTTQPVAATTALIANRPVQRHRGRRSNRPRRRRQRSGYSD
jgi:hypothetical protein